MEASLESETEIPVPAKKKISRRVGIIIISLIVIASIIAVSIFIYMMPTGPPPYNIGLNPQLITQKMNDGNNYVWVVQSLAGSNHLLKNDVYVWLKNESGFIIMAEPLTSASGTHGFEYVAANSGNNISIGDTFKLSRDYAVGSKIYLGNEAASGNYAILNVWQI